MRLAIPIKLAYVVLKRGHETYNIKTCNVNTLDNPTMHCVPNRRSCIRGKASTNHRTRTNAGPTLLPVLGTHIIVVSVYYAHTQ